jgi:hypothetical protein
MSFHVSIPTGSCFDAQTINIFRDEKDFGIRKGNSTETVVDQYRITHQRLQSKDDERGR